MSVPTKEDMLKKFTDPQTVTNAVQKFFTELDKDNTGYISVEGFYQLSEQMRIQFKAPEMQEERKKVFDECVNKNSTDGKMTKENLTVVMQTFFKGVEEYIKSLP